MGQNGSFIQKVELIFSGEAVLQPVIYSIGQEFPVVTNILEASIGNGGAGGRALIEIIGDNQEEINSIIDWLRENGVNANLKG
jgi:ABC-type methionine transport system ATPase subunit